MGSETKSESGPRHGLVHWFTRHGLHGFVPGWVMGSSHSGYRYGKSRLVMISVEVLTPFFCPINV